MNELKINIEDSELINKVFGYLDRNIKIIEENFDVEIVLRNDHILITGDNCKIAGKVMYELIAAIKAGDNIDVQKINYIISLTLDGKSYKETALSNGIICFTHKGKPIKPKTLGQANYAKAIKKNDIVFGVGPAGTGKTYIAVALAASAFKNKTVEKIILTRPAVEAGEKLGFLPGDLQEKVDPYLRPLYDALYDILGRENAGRLREKEIIEVIPLAYMRGRTFDNAFIILDEAQNTTKEQMKMFLTRLGFGSKVVVTGDITQTDLPRGKKSGLKQALQILGGVDGIQFCFLKAQDVVRHDLVKKIIEAYERVSTRDDEEDDL